MSPLKKRKISDATAGAGTSSLIHGENTKDIYLEKKALGLLLVSAPAVGVKMVEISDADEDDGKEIEDWNESGE